MTTLKNATKNVKQSKKRKYKHEREGYNSPEYIKWRNDIIERDKNKCQFPGCKRHKFGMEVHHILRWKDCQELRYDTSNGITLCGGKNGHHAKVTGNELVYAPMFLNIAKRNALRNAER